MPDDVDLSGAAWERRYRIVYARTYRYLRCAGVAHARAEELAFDATQTAILKTLKGMAEGKLSFPGEGQLVTWLCTAARNAAIDELRPSGPDLPPWVIPSPDSSPEDERIQRIADCVEKLPEQLRQVIKYSYYECKTDAALGTILGLGRQTARRLRLKALEALLRLFLDGGCP